jgi:hypothetical protein
MCMGVGVVEIAAEDERRALQELFWLGILKHYEYSTRLLNPQVYEHGTHWLYLGHVADNLRQNLALDALCFYILRPPVTLIVSPLT